MLKIAKMYPKVGSDSTKKSSFYFESGKTTKAAVVHGLKRSFILNHFENAEDPNMYQLMQLFNLKAKQCKTCCIFISNNALFYSYNCDCGIAVYDEMGNLKFHSVNNHTFGIFTGHRSYDQFINVGVMPVESHDVIVLYNGGFDKFIKSPEFWKNLNKPTFCVAKKKKKTEENDTLEKYFDSLAEKLDTSKERGILVFSLD